MADRSVVELPAPFLVDGNGSGSNGSNGKYSDVYYNVGGKTCRFTVNPTPAVQSPTKGLAAGGEANPAIIKKIALDASTKYQLCKPNKDGIVAGIWAYQLAGKQKIGKFWVNNGNEEMSMKDVKLFQEAIKKHCSVREDATLVTDPLADMYDYS